VILRSFIRNFSDLLIPSAFGYGHSMYGVSFLPGSACGQFIRSKQKFLE
jgi:hypothetical protein